MACEALKTQLANLQQTRVEIEQELHDFEGTPQERSRLLQQLKAIGSQITTTQTNLNICLQNAVVPAMAPKSILDIQYANPPINFNAADPNWAANIAGGQFPLHSGLEWKQVLDPTNEYDDSPLGVTGWIVSPETSGADLPFSHPFGTDWEFALLPDPAYNFLLAHGNLSSNAQNGYNNEIKRAGDLVKANNGNAHNTQIPFPVAGVLGIEMDKGLIPSAFTNNANVKEGDRVALFGRWIVDCGHTDFHTEIHPPLLMASASIQKAANGSSFTRAVFTSRPYLAAQKYTVSTGDIYKDGASDDGTFFSHLTSEIVKVDTFRSLQVEAHPKIKSFPFRGVHVFSFIVRTPAVPPNVAHNLIVSFHFTVRTSCAVQVIRNDDASVKVIIVMNNAGYVAPPLPHRNDRTYTRDDISKLDSDAGTKYLDVQALATAASVLISGVIGAAFVTYVLDKGIKTDQYDPLPDVNILDRQNAALNINAASIPANAGITHNDGQPYPIFGWLEVRADTAVVVAK